jgi:predicted  nucleic acid-binding Zn-ribbon protein
MVDVDSILLSVQERDKWRKRAEVLEHALRDVRDQRRRLETRLRRIKKEMSRLRITVDAVLDHRTRTNVRTNVATYASGSAPYR